MLGVSTDSIYSHKAFAAGFGGISYPLLSDFHPKGVVSEKYGFMDNSVGYPVRGVVVIDKAGIVRFKKFYPQGLPETAEVLTELDKVQKNSAGGK